MVWIALAVVAVFMYFMRFSRSGRRFYAVGNSMEAARISGIPVRRVLLTSYALTGAAAGLSGILYVCKYAAAQGETATGYEMNVIAACVLGGVSIAGGEGKVPGAVLGAVLLGMLNNALPLLRVSPFWQEAIRGGIILVSILTNVMISRRATKKALERRIFAR
jgi:rhamnose transport system permease protein